MVNSLRIGLATDLHICEPIPPKYERLSHLSHETTQKVVSLFNSIGLDSCFYLGDLFEARHYGLPELKSAHTLLSQTHSPWYVLRGNHDSRYKVTQDSYTTESFVDTFMSHGPVDNTLNFVTTFIKHKIAFIALNTSHEYTSEGWVPSSGLQWLETTFAQIPDDYRIVILSHHPIVSFHSALTQHPDTAVYVIKNSDEVHSYLKKEKRILAAICGHIHTFQKKQVDGITYFSIPSANSWPCQAAVMSVNHTSASISFHNLLDEKEIQLALHLFQTQHGWEAIHSAKTIHEFFKPGTHFTI